MHDHKALSLKLRASRRFAWHWAPVVVAGQSWKIATASDPDGMLLDACQRQDAGESGVIDPFWAAIWHAAAGLDQYLQSCDLVGQQVLELGCGTGRAGLSAALSGAQVTLTDGVSDPLLLVQLSVWPIRQSCTVRRLRFGKDRLGERKFPWILGSDITYLRSFWKDLEHTLRQHLAPGGCVLLSDPFRSIAHEFRDWVQARGWCYREEKVVTAGDQKRPIRIMKLQLHEHPSSC